MTVNYFRFKA